MAEKVLLIRTGDFPPREALDRLRERYEVVEVESVSQGLALMRRERFAGFIAQADALKTVADTQAVIQSATVLESMREGVMVLDRRGRVIYLNRQMERWGWTSPETLGRPFEEVFPAREGTCAGCRLREVFTTGQVLTHIHRCPDGRSFDLAVSPIFDRTGRVIQAVLSIRDVTERTELEEKLSAIYRAGREIASLDPHTIAHLSMEERINLLRESIIRHTREVLQYEHFEVRLIDRATNRLEVVVAAGALEKVRALELTVAETGSGITGHVAATGRSYNCGDTSNDPYYLVEMEGARSSLCVPLKLGDRVIGTFCVESTAPNAFDDTDVMFLELFGNYVAIALNTLELLVVEEVTARGRTADTVSLDVGVPLNEIASDAAALLEGYIGHDEESRVRLKSILSNVSNIREALRRAGQAETPFISPVPSTLQRDPELDGKRILVADDEEIIRETVSDALTKAGAIVDTARDGRETVALLKSNFYDLLIADIRMPHKNGYEVYREAKQLHPEIKVILMTAFGYDPSHSIPKARQEGLNDVLFKPFKVDDLKERIKHALKT